MPTPTVITDLSTTAASNFPAGSDAPSTIDDTLRAHGAFIAQLRDGPHVPSLASAGAPAYSFVGDTNTGAFSPSADAWAVSTGGSERVRVTAAGKVGIGTTTPSYKLHVVESAADTISAQLVNDEFQLVARMGDGGVTDGDVSAVFGTAYSGLATKGAVVKFHRGADTTGEHLSFWTTPASGTLTRRATITAAGDFVTNVNTSLPTLVVNGQMGFALTSDTNLRISVRGSDGVTRVANLTLA
jgi:hypothetical protein